MTPDEEHPQHAQQDADIDVAKAAAAEKTRRVSSALAAVAAPPRRSSRVAATEARTQQHPSSFRRRNKRVQDSNEDEDESDAYSPSEGLSSSGSSSEDDGSTGSEEDERAARGKGAAGSRQSTGKRIRVQCNPAVGANSMCHSPARPSGGHIHTVLDNEVHEDWALQQAIAMSLAAEEVSRPRARDSEIITPDDSAPSPLKTMPEGSFTQAYSSAAAATQGPGTSGDKGVTGKGKGKGLAAVQKRRQAALEPLSAREVAAAFQELASHDGQLTQVSLLAQSQRLGLELKLPEEVVESMWSYAAAVLDLKSAPKSLNFEEFQRLCGDLYS